MKDFANRNISKKRNVTRKKTIFRTKKDNSPLISKNKMRILLKERRNASDEEILNIANAICIDYPTLSKKESKEILSLLL